jgi:hypothetical protein
MNTEELTKLLGELPEDEQAKLIDKVKTQVQNSIKMAAEKKKREELKKQFKATGHWETQTEEEDSKITLDITEDNKNEIIFDFNEGDISFALSKKEFFNFYKLVTDAYNSLKESPDSTESLFSEDMLEKIKSLANSIYIPNGYRKPFRTKIFHIR